MSGSDPFGVRQPERNIVTIHRQPSWNVKLFRHSDGTPLHDIYGLNDDILSLDVNQSIADPGATWSITLPPQRKYGGALGLKWDMIASPWDYVEIGLRERHSDPYVVVLRGFVDNVFEADVISTADGNPSRRVVLNGRNFGKLWLEDKIFYLQELLQGWGGQPLAVLERYWGITASEFTPAEFLLEIWTKIMLPKLEARRKLNPNIPMPIVACSVPDKYRIYSRNSAIQAFTGPLWNLINMFAGAPYTEFLIRDIPGTKQTFMEWRWAPLLTRGNVLPLAGQATIPAIHTYHTSMIDRVDTGTGDNDRYTYFWATPTQYVGTGYSNVTKISNPGYIDGDGINLYGFKPFEPEFRMYSMYQPGAPGAEQTANQAEWGPQVNELTGWLVDTFIWAIEMHEGDATLRLSPKINVGDYLDIVEKNRRFYVEGVHHAMIAGQSPTTTLTLTRGLALDDAAVPRPKGYDPKSGDPIPGGARQGGPVPYVPATPATGTTPTNTAPLPYVPPGDQSNVVKVAAQFLGAKYSHAGTYRQGITDNLLAETVGYAFKDGIDCSQLVEACYHFGLGIRLPPTAQNQYNNTYHLKREEVIPGDLLFFQGTSTPNPGETITHVGIYVGSNMMINAEQEGTPCRVTDATTSYWQGHFVCGGRAAPGTKKP